MQCMPRSARLNMQCYAHSEPKLQITCVNSSQQHSFGKLTTKECDGVICPAFLPCGVAPLLWPSFGDPRSRYRLFDSEFPDMASILVSCAAHFDRCRACILWLGLGSSFSICVLVDFLVNGALSVVMVDIASAYTLS